MKALTIKQPWARLVARGIKDIENRTWKTNFRGRVYIHAAAKGINGSLINILSADQYHDFAFNSNNFLDWEQHLSAIIGEVDIVDCVVNHSSVWAEKGQSWMTGEYKPIYNWVLANAVLYPEPILNVKGKLSFWEFEKPEG